MKKKTWQYITLVFTVVGISLWVFSAVPVIGSHAPSATSYITLSDIDIDKWDMDVTNIQRLEILSIDPETLDQAQDIINQYFKICLGGDGYWMCQSIKNYREPLTAFSVGIGRHGTPWSPTGINGLFIGIMDPLGNPEDPDDFIFVGYIPPEAIPEDDVFYWMSVDLSSDPIDIPPETFFKIVVISFSMPHTEGYWMLGTSGTQNPYDRGVLASWDFTNNWWDCTQIGCGYDMCFATYTVESDGPPPDAPVITITSTSQVVSQVFGSLSLLGAAVSGIKYYTLVV